jgi:hypothetical protein
MAALVLWDRSGQSSIDSLLSSLLPYVQRLFLLRLPGGEEAAKRRFFREGVYSEPLGAIPAGRKAARELLVHLGIA